MRSMLGSMGFRSRTPLSGSSSSSTPSRTQSSQSQAPNNDKVFKSLEKEIDRSCELILKKDGQSVAASFAFRAARAMAKEAAKALIEFPGAGKVVGDVFNEMFEDFSDPENVINQETKKAEAGFKSNHRNEARNIVLQALADAMPNINDTDFDDPVKKVREFILPSQGNLNQKCGKYIQSVLNNIKDHKALNTEEKGKLEGIVKNFESDYNAKVEKRMGENAPLMGTNSNSSARTPDQIREDEFYKSALQIKDPYGDVTNPMWGG